MEWKKNDRLTQDTVRDVQILDRPAEIRQYERQTAYDTAQNRY